MVLLSPNNGKIRTVAKGVRKKLRLPILESCAVCQGSGSKSPEGPKVCDTCNGAGEIRRVQRSVFGQFVSASTCPSCGGEGRRIVQPVPHDDDTPQDRDSFLGFAALLLSFTDFDLYALADAGNARFVGLGNYVQLLQTPLFWKALGNTFYFVLVGGPLSVAVSLGAALLVSAKLVRFKSFFRTAFFAPVVTTLVAVAVVWRYLYHTRYGFLNYALGWIGIEPIDWMGDPTWRSQEHTSELQSLTGIS